MASQSSSTTTWWARDKKESLQARIDRIGRINDPTTNYDEVLRYGRWFLYLLLLFTGLLGGISYYKNFSTSFPPQAAFLMALALTFVIEWGKNYCTSWGLRIPFFRGWAHISETQANTLIWGGLITVAVVTFTMSVYNSTRGGEQLSRMLSHERDTTLFSPDTRAIDAQIAAAQGNIAEASKTKWKGTTTVHSQRAILATTKSIESLNRQRENAVAQQRADWEKKQAIRADNTNYAANLVLASGGWVELLQFLLILICCACEKALDGRYPSPSSKEDEKGIGFRRGPAIATFDGSPTTSPDVAPRRPIGFYPRDTHPDLPSSRIGTAATSHTVPPENAVEQCSTAEQPDGITQQEQTYRSAADSLVADVKDWKKRAQQVYQRAQTSQRPEFRQDNQQRYMCYAIMLSAVGVIIKTDDHGKLIFRDPAKYTINDQVTEVIIEQTQRLERISAERRVGA